MANMVFFAAIFIAMISTIGGALFALKMRKFLRPLIGLSAGLLIGVAFFDLMPESFEILGDFHLLSLGIIAGFLFYLVLERFLLFHACTEEKDSHHYHFHQGFLGLAGLSVHRAMDGLVIGLSFASSESLGILVSLAIIAHSFPDGMNAVAIMLAKDRLQFRKWIALLGAAIFAGGILSLFISVPESVLGLVISFVAGWFLYLGASDLLPEAHKESANLAPLAATIIGLALIYGISRLLAG